MRLASGWFFCLILIACLGCKPKATPASDVKETSLPSSGDRCTASAGFELRNGTRIDGNQELSRRFAGVGMVSRTISEQQRKVCTGTLVSDRHVLTARHCVVSDPGTQKALVDVASITFHPIGEPVEKAVTEILVPDYDADHGPAYADVALLVLKTPMSSVPYFSVYRGDDFPLLAGEEVETVGFGWFVDTEQKQKDASIGDPRFGKMTFNEISSFRLDPFGPVTVAMTSPGKDNQLSCEGDSGGPAFFRMGNMDMLVGVVSASRGEGGTSTDRCRQGERIELAPTPQFAAWLNKHVPDSRPGVNMAAMTYAQENKCK